MEKSDLIVEARLIKLESESQNTNEDIKEIKKSLRWITGLIFSLNTTIIGILTKGFGVI